MLFIAWRIENIHHVSTVVQRGEVIYYYLSIGVVYDDIFYFINLLIATCIKLFKWKSGRGYRPQP